MGASVVLLLAAACSSSAQQASQPLSTLSTVSTNSSASPSTSSSLSTSTTAPVASCTPASGYGSGTAVHHVRSGGIDRAFLVHLPPRPTHRMRLVVDFHGATSSMQAQSVYSGFDALSDAHDFVVATPNGVDAAVRQWNFLGTADVEFAVALVHELVAHACVDGAHVVATGISSGGAMTAALACRASKTFAGFAPVAADFYVPAICDRAEQRPIVIFHGTADAVVPYGGGRVRTNNTLPVSGAEATAAKWAQHDGCEAQPTLTRLGTQVVRLTWRGCAASVVMYRIEGGGHTWPGATISVPLGLTTQQIRASDEVWKLLASI